MCSNKIKSMKAGKDLQEQRRRLRFLYMVERLVNQFTRGAARAGNDVAHVFEPFAVIGKPTYVQGTGLGLSLSKGLVEAHGGEIWAESEGEGKVTASTITVPQLIEET